MVKIIYTYDVASERQAEYLKATAEKIKPFWESHGCISYTLWQSPEQSHSFTKEMLFNDEAIMKKTINLSEAEPIKNLFSQYATNVKRNILVQKL